MTRYLVARAMILICWFLVAIACRDMAFILAPVATDQFTYPTTALFVMMPAIP